MSTLKHHANNVLMEFGGILPDHLLSFEDVMRRFVRVWALEKQKLGISDTDKTTTSQLLAATQRSGAVPTTWSTSTDVMPGFVELKLTDSSNPNSREKVEIVPLKDIPSFEGARTIAFYGKPLKYKLSFNSWEEGTLEVFFDPVPDFDQVTGDTVIDFPQQFLVYLEIKTRFSLIDLVKLKLSYRLPSALRDQAGLILESLARLQQTWAMEMVEWERQFDLWKDKDVNEGPRLRRTFDELSASGRHNVTRHNPLDFVD